jgi:hypothetical protein
MTAVRRRTATAALVAVAAAGLVAAGAGVSQAAVTRTTPTAHTAASSAASARIRPLAVRFVSVTTPVAKPKGAAFQGVTVSVTGGRPGVARAVATAMARHVTALRTSFTTVAADEDVVGGVPGTTVFDAVSGLSARSVHYLSIRIDESVNLGGAHPANVSHAYVFDLATGREIRVAKLFVSPAATDRAVRAALVAANQRVVLTRADVAELSIVPDRHGSTGPLSCYPTGPGLHCIVDQGGVLGYAAGPLEATVPWRSLAVRR